MDSRLARRRPFMKRGRFGGRQEPTPVIALRLPHSITSSASRRKESRTVRPSACAAIILTTVQTWLEIALVGRQPFRPAGCDQYRGQHVERYPPGLAHMT